MRVRTIVVVGVALTFAAVVGATIAQAVRERSWGPIWLDAWVPAVTAERCAAQLLRGDLAGSPEEVAGRLLAIQAQDPRGARLAIRARSAGLSAADVDSALARRSHRTAERRERGWSRVRCRPCVPTHGLRDEPVP